MRNVLNKKSENLTFKAFKKTDYLVWGVINLFVFKGCTKKTKLDKWNKKVFLLYFLFLIFLTFFWCCGLGASLRWLPTFCSFVSNSTEKIIFQIFCQKLSPRLFQFFWKKLCYREKKSFVIV